MSTTVKMEVEEETKESRIKNAKEERERERENENENIPPQKKRKISHHTSSPAKTPETESKETKNENEKTESGVLNKIAGNDEVLKQVLTFLPPEELKFPLFFSIFFLILQIIKFVFFPQ